MNCLIMNIFHTRSGINQNEASTYSITKLYFEQASEQPNAQPNAQAKGQADEYIITKLNLLFNYIYEEGSGKEIGLKQKDKEPLITLLKRLEMYCSTSEIYKLMPEERVLDEKIMFWALKEIYLSPHRVYLNNLKRDKFTLKYYKTKKYIMEKPEYRLEEVINYFIVCLHEEMEKEKWR